MASTIADRVRAAATLVLPLGLRQWLRAQQRRLGVHRTPVGAVAYGDLRRLAPISPVFGLDRSVPVIDRYYIDRFLASHADDISGRVLEMGDAAYTSRFGGDRVTRSDVLHYIAGNPEATIVADLTKADHIPPDSFDCIILTQTLQMIFDVRAALHHLHRTLKPGGVLLATSHASAASPAERVSTSGASTGTSPRSRRGIYSARCFPPTTLRLSPTATCCQRRHRSMALPRPT